MLEEMGESMVLGLGIMLSRSIHRNLFFDLRPVGAMEVVNVNSN